MTGCRYSGERITAADFLGQPGDLSHGPWLLAGLLQCPANLLLCLKPAGLLQVHLEQLAIYIQCTVASARFVASAVQRYAECCLEVPSP